jgi:drug/metabolite transporter superfamily protein YnfA
MFHETADKLEIAGSWQVFIIRWVEWNQSAFAISPDVAGLAVFSFMNLASFSFDD